MAEILVKREAFLAAVNKAAAAVPNRTPAEDYFYLLVEADAHGLCVTGQSGEFGVQTRCEAQIDGSESFLLKASQLQEALAVSRQPEIRIKRKRNRVVATFQGNSHPAEFEWADRDQKAISRFPTPGKVTFTVMAAALAEGLNHVSSASSATPGKYTLQCVQWKRAKGILSWRAMDSRCGASRSIASEGDDFEALVPDVACQKMASKAAKILDTDAGEVQVSVEENTIHLSQGGTSAYARLMAGKFAPWERFVPNPERHEHYTIEVAADELHRTIAQAKAVVDPKQPVGVLTFDGQECIVSSQSELGKARVGLGLEAELPAPFQVRLDLSLCMDGLSKFRGGPVTLELYDPAKPFVLRRGTSSFWIMPYSQPVSPEPKKETAAA